MLIEEAEYHESHCEWLTHIGRACTCRYTRTKPNPSGVRGVPLRTVMTTSMQRSLAEIAHHERNC